ncbi:MAG: hypothetical protein ACW97A_14645 [Candidatus Thorarchaeota archaeon]|jgi:hypothetical protein
MATNITKIDTSENTVPNPRKMMIIGMPVQSTVKLIPGIGMSVMPTIGRISSATTIAVKIESNAMLFESFLNGCRSNHELVVLDIFFAPSF